jgi:hypothetical protein
LSEVTTVVAPKKRGRPPKNKTPTVETNSASFEYNTNLGTSWLLYSTYGDTFPYTIDQINGYIKQPMENNSNCAKWPGLLIMQTEAYPVL